MFSTKPAEPDQTASESPIERRRNLRFPFTASVEAIENNSGTRVAGRTSDLGLGGCYVDTLNPFPVGADAKVRIQRENVTFEAQAKVVFSSIGMGMGLAFVSAQSRQVRIFQKWLLEISGKSAPIEDVGDLSESAPTGKTGIMNNAVLSNLIVTLIQKKILSQQEGKEMLRQLFR